MFNFSLSTWIGPQSNNGFKYLEELLHHWDYSINIVSPRLILKLTGSYKKIKPAIICCSVILPSSTSFQGLLWPILCSTFHMATSEIAKILFTLMLKVRQRHPQGKTPYIWINEISLENLRKAEAQSHKLLLNVDHKLSPNSCLSSSTWSPQLNATLLSGQTECDWTPCVAEAPSDMILLTEVPELLVRNRVITCLLIICD